MLAIHRCVSGETDATPSSGSILLSAFQRNFCLPITTFITRECSKTRETGQEAKILPVAAGIEGSSEVQRVEPKAIHLRQTSRGGERCREEKWGTFPCIPSQAV